MCRRCYGVVEVMQAAFEDCDVKAPASFWERFGFEIVDSETIRGSILIYM